VAGLKWIRLDTSIFENPKFLYLIEDRQYKSITVHIAAMCYSGRHGLDGFVPKSALRVIGSSTSDATKLVTNGLWMPAPGGWQINGWAEYQLSNDEVKTRSDKARKAAASRWNSSNGGPVW
jgi:hypothetical protein